MAETKKRSERKTKEKKMEEEEEKNCETLNMHYGFRAIFQQ